MYNLCLWLTDNSLFVIQLNWYYKGNIGEYSCIYVIADFGEAKTACVCGWLMQALESLHMPPIKVTFSDESGQNLNLVKATQFDGKMHVKSGWHVRFSKMSTYFVYLLFKISLLNFSIHKFKMVMLWCNQPISLQIKKYTEIQERYFKRQILKIWGHFGKF